MRESLEVIEERAGVLRGLVQELLGFSRSDTGPDEVSLADVVQRIVALQRVSHGRTVVFEERILWHDTVVASAVRVEQILSNLLSNAVDAAPAGRGIVGVTLWRDGQDAVVEVADNGEGIDPELGDRIFEPFVSTKDTEQGTGLGLAICRRLALAMGGTLSARNHAEGGAVFELRLPIAAEKADTAARHPMGASTSGEALAR
ncbi:MAG: HAMP domain-containing sensor histidine kinase [Gemmatimonadota bacterium]|nr:HAMP domain-containing sensor histidine kinase [Gemmatimonadota bacterium]